MSYKQTLDKALEEIKSQMNTRSLEIRTDVRKAWDCADKIMDEVKCIKSRLEGKNCEDNIYLQRMNDFLMQIISKKYDKGTIIFYDERDPRQVTVVRNGKKVDMDKATELSFYWEPNQFPTLEITR